MRQIKFDVMLWDGEDPGSIEHYTFYEALREDFMDFDDDDFMIPLDESIIIRGYTGLKDKNGKEIYEGDILEHKENYEPYKCVMEWNTELGSCDCCDEPYQAVGFVGRVAGKTDYSYSTLASEYDKMEIIGNIYENPELLE